MRQILLDTETTGLSPAEGHRIIEVGCVEMVGRRFTGNNFHHYINPQREIDAGAEQVHGISNEFVADKPVFAQIIDELFAYLEGAELLIHNAPFDVGFLDHEFKLAGKKYGNIHSICRVTCTLQMARKKHPGQKNSLDALCKRYDVDNSNRQLHGALLDSELLADVYLAMTRKQECIFGDTVKENSSQAIKLIEPIKVERNRELPIISATTDEEQAHQRFIEMMQGQHEDELIWPE